MDVGGENSHRLSPIYYTSIAEIKGFRFKLEKTIPTNGTGFFATAMERSIATRRDIPH